MNDETKKRIISAAGERFAHYGYGKTTMAEIAKDCDMSVGNLYRFYKNKEAIAAAGAEACFLEKAETGEAANDQNRPSIEQLSAFLIARLRYMHRFVSETPHMHEIVELISTKHQELLQHYEDRAIDYMAGIIESGQKRGEIRAGDPLDMAMNLYRAMISFNMPLCMFGPLNEKEIQLQSLLEAFFIGLGNREGEI